MRTYSFAIQKGGTGKTTVSVSVAVELARQGKKVVLIDGDPQGNSSSWLLDDLEYELADVLYGNVELKAAYTKTKIENLTYIPTAGLNGELRNYATKMGDSKPFLFRHLLPELAKDFDYCIIDTSPSFTGLEKSIFLASDEVIAVMQVDYFSTDGLQIFLDNLSTLKKDFDSNEKPEFNKIVMNVKDNRIKYQDDMISQLKNLKKFDFFMIPVDQAFKKAQTMHICVQDFASCKKETLDAIADIARSLA